MTSAQIRMDQPQEEQVRHRRVFVTLKIETDAPLADIRKAYKGDCAIHDGESLCGYEMKVLQVQVSVARPVK